ncbi:hypothetical protein DFH09DRAFT_1174671, partial [Mycena vulgaris]
GHLGQLEELQLTGVWGGPTAPPESDRLTAFAVAPRLCILSVVNVCEPAMSLLLPWHQLTQYRGINGGHEHFSVLMLCPNLINVHLTFRTTMTVADNPSGHLHVTNAEFLSIMSLPRLEAITLEKMAPDDDALLPFLALVRRDKPPLACISLLHSTLVAPTLISILTETPTVETLHIHVRRDDTPAVNALIEALTLKPGHSACFAPNLTDLEFSGRGAFDQARFLDMIHSRWGYASECGCGTLEQITIRMTQKAALSPSTVEQLQALAQEGLVLSITTFSFFSDKLTDPYQ